MKKGDKAKRRLQVWQMAAMGDADKGNSAKTFQELANIRK